jgi:hypothetical protein
MNPLAYGTKALLVNEMEGQIYSCEGPGNSVPYGPGRSIAKRINVTFVLQFLASPL